MARSFGRTARAYGIYFGQRAIRRLSVPVQFLVFSRRPGVFVKPRGVGLIYFVRKVLSHFSYFHHSGPATGSSCLFYTEG